MFADGLRQTVAEVGCLYIRLLEAGIERRPEGERSCNIPPSSRPPYSLKNRVLFSAMRIERPQTLMLRVMLNLELGTYMLNLELGTYL